MKNSILFFLLCAGFLSSFKLEAQNGLEITYFRPADPIAGSVTEGDLETSGFVIPGTDSVIIGPGEKRVGFHVSEQFKTDPDSVYVSAPVQLMSLQSQYPELNHGGTAPIPGYPYGAVKLGSFVTGNKIQPAVIVANLQTLQYWEVGFHPSDAGAAGVAHNGSGKYYLVGGTGAHHTGPYSTSIYEGTIIVDSLAPGGVTFTWDTLTVSFPIMDHVAVYYHGGRLYIFGGRNSDMSDPLCPSNKPFGKTLTNAIVYNIANDSIEAVVPMPIPASGAMVVMCGNIIWVIGGERNDFCANNEGYDVVRGFDVTTNTWTYLYSMADGRHSGIATYLEGVLVVIDGAQNSGGSNTPDPSDGKYAVVSVLDSVVDCPGVLNTNGPMPVEVIDFVWDGYSSFVWGAAMEINVSYYLIRDVISKKEIGHIDALGEGDHEYVFLVEASMSYGYYQLVSVDFDGNVQYHSIVEAGDKTQLYSHEDLLVYPNPATSRDAVTVETSGSLKIFDLNGQDVTVLCVPEFDGFDYVLDINQLAVGTYIVQSMQGGQMLTRKLIVH